MDKTTFLAICKEKGYSQDIQTRFAEATDFSKKILIRQKRLAGDSYYEHNLRVASILVENVVDPQIVLAGILSGTAKHIHLDNLRTKFGDEIVSLVQGVQAIQQIKSQSSFLQAKSLKRMLLTTLKDVRVLFIKLATKLDNLRTINVLPASDQKRISEEVLEIYAPLAYRLGMDKMRVILEDVAFNIVNPQKYQEISRYIEKSKQERIQELENVISQTKITCNGKVQVIRVLGRQKQIYSIYKKMSQGKNLREIFDLVGIRIIVPDIKDCYTALALLHENHEPIPDRLKDYIANPKPNFYRSIHTGLMFPGHKRVEVQIRTLEMDKFAEEGLAAHWRYKGIKSLGSFDKKISWLKGVLELQRDVKHKEFLETLKVDIFGDKTYCYTPKGDVKELPNGATLLDFAFSIHEEVGSKAVGGRVNGKFVPLRHVLSVGDVVAVITNKNQRPRRSWIKFVVSAKSKQKIRKSLKEHESLPALHYRSFKPQIKDEQGILVESSEFPQSICLLAKCCQPVPGEDIIGIITKRRIVSTHRDDCRYALKEQNRWIPVQWKNGFNQKINFLVNAEERSGLLADILHTIATAGFEVKEAKAKMTDDVHAQCSFSVIPRDLDHLRQLITRVEKVHGVMKMYFD
jgi:GTP diphosphokinase / guanosine-3',5'-bis(diphosphate) 3'-diphosphatase